MSIYLDLNIIRGKIEFPAGSIVPLWLVFELFTSDTIENQNRKKCYERIKNINIDPRLPIKNKTKNIYDYTFIKNDIYKLSYEEFERKGREIFQWFKNVEKNIGNGFIQHQFLKDEESRNIFNKYFRNNEDRELKIIDGLKKRYAKEIPCSEEEIKIFNMDMFNTIFVYYHFKGMKIGTPGRNDFTDLHYLLYLNSEDKLYTNDNDLKEALIKFFPNNLYCA
jgi:hypothetical protein